MEMENVFHVMPRQNPWDSYTLDIQMCGTTTTSTILESVNGYVYITDDKKISVLKRVLERSLKVPVHFYQDYFSLPNGIFLHVWRIGIELKILENQYAKTRDKLERVLKFMQQGYEYDFDFSNKISLIPTEDMWHFIYIVPIYIERFYTTPEKTKLHSRFEFPEKKEFSIQF
jgi:hypothetical protein